MNENTPNNTVNNTKKDSLALKVLLIFGAVMVLLCFFIFIFNYDIAFEDSSDGGWLPPSFAIVFYYFLLAVVGFIGAIIIKVIFKKRVSIWILLLATVLVPIVSYKANRFTLKEDGPFYFLVDEGGIFRFIAIGDYDFDGMNDELYHRTYDTRTLGSTYCGGGTIIKSINVRVTGVGYNLGGHSFYEEEQNEITLHLRKDNVVYDKVEMKIEFRNPEDAKKFNMTLVSQNDHGKMIPVDYKLDYEYRINDDNTLTFIFDAEDCKRIQNHSTTEFVEVAFNFSV